MSSLQPTSSGVMFLTETPLISSIWSPMCAARSMSLLRTDESNLWDSDNGWGFWTKCFFAYHCLVSKLKMFQCVLHSETHPVTVTRGPVSWLRSVVMVRPRLPPAQGGKDTSATMWGLLVSGESDLPDTAPWQKQLPLQNRHQEKHLERLFQCSSIFWKISIPYFLLTFQIELWK